ncbi:serine/threonine protein kinase [Paenibacillus medicaginis]|uniref:Serine/threonine protein kinase n=1 Tax=Paenibacillus medicaginis TaxID=1470560 RepID=A0ABV5BXY6_9BACL
MSEEWRKAESVLQRIEVIGTPDNTPVTINGYAEGVHCIGIGTDAAVFTLDSMPEYAFKIYSELAAEKKSAEASVYEKLRGCPSFPVFYGEGDRYIVISYEKGITLMDCLLQGIPVPEQVIQDVEEARDFVRSRGLNPRDIHLKNVLLQNGRAKVLDVSEYVKEGDDKRWEHLVWAYHTFYSGFAEARMPSWVLDTIKNWYYRLDKANLNLEEFAQRVNQLFSRWIK